MIAMILQRSIAIRQPQISTFAYPDPVRREMFSGYRVYEQLAERAVIE